MVDSKRTRGTNVVELQAVADPRTGTAIVIGAVDNLVKGAAGQAIQNMNLVLGLDEDDRPADAWRCTRERHVPPRLPGRRRLRRAQAERRGPTSRCSSAEPGTTVAGLFTTNLVAAAPVAARPRAARGAGAATAVVVNSGQANAATGERGMADAVDVDGRASRTLLGVERR